MNRLLMSPLLWAAPGFLIQCYGLLQASPACSLTGAIWLTLALGRYIRTKGLHPIWALWSLLPVAGPLLLIMWPPRIKMTPQQELETILLEEDPSVRPLPPPPPQMLGGVPLLILAIIIGLAIILAPCIPKPTEKTIAKPKVQPEAITPSITETSQPPESITESPVTPPPFTANTGTLTSSPVTEPPTPTMAEEKSSTPPGSPPSPEESPFAIAYRQIRLRMTFDDITKLVGNDISVISGEVGGDTIVRWEGPGRMSFGARFREGKLDRITALHVPPEESPYHELVAEILGKANKPVGTTSAKASTVPTAKSTENQGEEIEEAPSTPLSLEEQKSVETTPPTTEEPPATSTDQTASQTGEPAIPTPRVVRLKYAIAATARQSYKNAKLPSFSRALPKGTNDIRIINPLPGPVKVGIRSGKMGKNISIPGGSEATIYVNKGDYTFYYIQAQDPGNIHNAGNVVVDAPLGLLQVVLD